MMSKYSQRWMQIEPRLKEFLARHGIAFVERNLSVDAAARAEHAQLGYRGVPVVRAQSERFRLQGTSC